MRKITVIATIATAALAAGLVHAERLNIDFGNPGSAPSSGWGAAAGQSGVWNNFIGGAVSAPLLNTAGAATDVTVQSAGGPGIFSSADLGYTGDLANLLNDALDRPDTVTINNLDAGDYDLLTYATDPEIPALCGTIITINGVSRTVIGPEVVGGVMIMNVHYARHAVTHGGGALTINLDDLPGGSVFYNCNGLQIVPRNCRNDIAPAGGDGQVNVTDLLAVITAWGACPQPPANCPNDINFDGQVGVGDLLSVIGAWGPCQ